MAQLLILDHARCEEKHCGHLAVRELRSGSGIIVGKYCQTDGDMRLRHLQAFEDNEATAGRIVRAAHE